MGGRFWALKKLLSPEAIRVKDESQMAATRRPEGLLAAGGGRRSGAGIGM